MKVSKIIYAFSFFLLASSWGMMVDDSPVDANETEVYDPITTAPKSDAWTPPSLPESTDIQYLLSKAREHIDRGNATGEPGRWTGAYVGGREYEQARLHYAAAEKEMRRQQVDVLRQYGWFLYRTASGIEKNQGLAMLNEAALLGPDDSLLLSMLGYTELQRYYDDPSVENSLNTAKDYLEHAIAVDESNAYAYWLLSQIHATRKDGALSRSYLIKFMDHADATPLIFYLWQEDERSRHIELIRTQLGR